MVTSTAELELAAHPTCPWSVIFVMEKIVVTLGETEIISPSTNPVWEVPSLNCTSKGPVPVKLIKILACSPRQIVVSEAIVALIAGGSNNVITFSIVQP